MERPGCCRALLWGEGLTDAQPCEGEPDGGHRGAESLGGGTLLQRDGLLGLTLSASGGCVLAGVGGCGYCCGHTGSPRSGDGHCDVRSRIG
jgi:hypothetical protein